MNTTTDQLKRENRLLDRIGSLEYIASTITCIEVKMDVVRKEEDLIRDLQSPVEEQYRDGLISPSERMAKMAEYHFAIKEHAAIAAKIDAAERKRVAEKKGSILGVLHQPGSLVIIGKSKEKWVDDGDGQAYEQWDAIIPNGTRTLVTVMKLDALLEGMPPGCYTD